MNKLHLKKLGLIFCMIAMPWLAHAASLGKLNVFSALGEPLNAEIELTSVSAEEFPSLTASLASDDFYLSQGVDKSAIQKNISISVTKKPNGDPVIQLSSSQAVTDPFLDMLIQVVWTDGQLTREYTLLLDPPSYSASRAAAPTIESAKPITEPNSAQQRLFASLVAAGKRNHSRNALSESASGQTITTVKGDALSAIALRLNIQEVDLDQLLIGLYQSNPSAFAGNINRLKIGQVLQIPSLETLQAIDKKEAKAEVRAQVSNWQAYSAKLADAANEAEASDVASNSQSKGRIITEDKTTPAPEANRDVVKLAKVDASKESASSGNQADLESSVANKITNLQDDLAAKQKEIKEANDQSAALAKQIADMKKLLAIQNKTLAEGQQRAAQTKDKKIISDFFGSVAFLASGVLLAVLAGFLLWVKRKNKTNLSTFSLDTENTVDTQAIESIENAETLPSNEDVDVSAQEVPHLNLSGITLNFDSVEHLNTTSASAAPIPDAFNGDFSNLLKVEKFDAPKKAKVGRPAKVSRSAKTGGEDSAEVATKLELAAAYIDMADKAGALKLLTEALKDGSPAQCERAQALIDSLA